MQIRDNRTEKRFFVDNIIIDIYGKMLGPIGLATYMALCRMADKDTQTCYPSYETLADRIGAGRSTVGSRLRLMKSLKLISWIQQPLPGKGSKLSSNVYTLLDPPQEVVVQEMDYPSPALGLGVVQEMDGNNPQLEQSSAKFPAPPSRASAAEPETIPVDAEGDPLDDYHPGSRPKWQCPETVFQREFLGVCRAKWFKPKQKNKVKKLAKCLDVGDVLGDGVYQRCLDELKDCESFPDRPLAMPRSWYEWRAGHARSNRWSVDGFINALFDRDALVRHCQMHLKRRGVPAIELVEDKDAPVVMLGGK